MKRRGIFTDDQIMAALNETHGMVFLAAERLGCSHITIQRRSLSTPAVRTLIEKWRGRLVDKSELKLEAAIDNGEPWAVAMTLKTRGKDRGYVERQEHTGAEGGPMELNVSGIREQLVNRVNRLITAPGQDEVSEVLDRSGSGSPVV